jgi:hypothetical protein
MKTIKIGDTKYKQIETAEDLSVQRYAMLKEYIIWKETGVDTPNLADTITKYVHAFDNESKAAMLTTLYDYMTGIKQAREQVDADQMIFALITLESDEDMIKTNDGFLKEKLARMNENGLTQKVVEETVENFIQASSAHFVSFFKENMTRQMTESLPQ